MRMATVVFPVPGLPVKDMCREGEPDTSPSSFLARSTTNKAAMSRIRVFTGFKPMSSASSSSRTSLTRVSASNAPRSIRSVTTTPYLYRCPSGACVA
jgi:hypothetical protein